MKIFGLLLGMTIALFTPLAHANLNSWFIKKTIEQKVSRAGPNTMTVQWFTQKLNHFDSSDTRTFQQRFAISNGTGGASGPVFYYQAGEGNALDQDVVPDGVKDAAQQLGASIVVLEHRYYGRSQPFADMSAANLVYLSYEQSLEDMATFQKYAQAQLGLNGKWIMVGGSYAGALSAFYRLKHPELVVGAWSSSGVVKSVEAYEDYDLFVAKGLGPSCLTFVQNATHEIERRLDDSSLRQGVKDLFNASDLSDLDLLSVVASIPAYAVQYGEPQLVCNYQTSSDPVSGLATAGQYIFSYFGVTPSEMAQGLESTNAADYEDGVGLRQWEWQSCTEFGGFDVPYHDPKMSAQSSRLTLTLALQGCQDLFGLKQPPETDRTNKDFYQPLLNPTTSNIFYTNGSSDPYSPLSISAEAGDNTNPNTTAFTLTGMSHCSDLELNDSSALVQQAQVLFQKLARQWL